MARLGTIDDNERRKYAEYNQRTYGTTLDAARNSRRVKNSNPSDYRSIEYDVPRNTNQPSRTAKRPARNRSRRNQRPSYRPNRKDKQTKIKSRARKRVSIAVRWLVRFISLGLLLPQAIFGFITLAMLGVLTLVDGSLVARVVLAFFDGVLEAAIAIPWFIMISIGWGTVVIVLVILKMSGAKPLMGKNSAIKIAFFLSTLVLYTIPGANLIPWCIFWAEYVIRHPE